MAETMAQTEKPAAEKAKAARREVSVKFGRGLVEDSFTTRNGTEMLSIRVPNRDPEDKRPWESFAVPAKMVHTNQYGKGLYMKLPEDGTTKLTRSVMKGQDDKGKNIWGSETRFVSNKELKAMMETYRDQSRDSVLSDLGEKKGTVSQAEKADADIGADEKISVVAKEDTKEAPKKAAKKMKEAER